MLLRQRRRYLTQFPRRGTRRRDAHGDTTGLTKTQDGPCAAARARLARAGTRRPADRLVPATPVMGRDRVSHVLLVVLDLRRDRRAARPTGAGLGWTGLHRRLALWLAFRRVRSDRWARMADARTRVADCHT